MLLIVFIENAFKHAKNTVDDRIFIAVKLKTGVDTIDFSVENSHSKPAENNSFANRHSGFGLDNVTKRLELLYPGEYALDIKSTDKSYSATLKLRQK
jgi:sensor histidine kinase YesM